MNTNYAYAGSTVTCCGKEVTKKKCYLYSFCLATLTILLCVGIGILIYFLAFYDDGTVKETVVETEETEFMVITLNATGNSTAQPTQIVEIVVEKTYSWYLPNGGEFAVNGHDVVEYFNIDSSDDAVKGDEENYTYEWQGVKWAFVSQENLDLFIANPTNYAPRYGGYCAYAMAVSGGTARGDPDAWSIHNGQLYINLSNSIRNTWKSDKDGYIEDADDNWNDYDNDNWDNN